MYADPNPAVKNFDIHFKNAFRAIRSKLISVKHFKQGEQIGGFVLTRDSLIGVAPIGLGDGLPGKNKDHSVLIRGQRCIIRGSVSLKHIRVDVTDVDGASVEDEVTILGKQGTEQITVNELCDRADYSSAQLWTSINSSSVPYVFMKDGEAWDIEQSD